MTKTLADRGADIQQHATTILRLKANYVTGDPDWADLWEGAVRPLIASWQADDESGELAPQLDALHALNALAAGVAVALGTQVSMSRYHGASWSDVGRALGVTKQAAQQRFGDPEGSLNRAGRMTQDDARHPAPTHT
jgi:hypothetical protein